MKYWVLRWNSPLKKMAKTIFKLKLPLYLKNRNFRFFGELHFLRITIYPPRADLGKSGLAWPGKKFVGLADSLAWLSLHWLESKSFWLGLTEAMPVGAEVCPPGPHLKYTVYYLTPCIYILYCIFRQKLFQTFSYFWRWLLSRNVK
jgi:hypothetical protein